MYEPGNKNGDGYFEGIYSTVGGSDGERIYEYWSASGDLMEYIRVFVGTWKDYNSEDIKECIFSYDASGLYKKLPFRDFIYEADEDFEYYYELKDELLQYGWSDYIPLSFPKDEWWIED